MNIEKLIEKYKDKIKMCELNLMGNSLSKYEEVLSDLEQFKKHIQNKIAIGTEAIKSPYCLPKIQKRWINKIKIYTEIIGTNNE